MEDILDQPEELCKMYKEKAILAAAFFGGPLVVGYMLSINFRRTARETKGNWSLILGFVILTLMLIFSFTIPKFDKIPDFLFNIAYVFGARAVFLRCQKKEVILHIQNGGEVYNWWVVAGLVFLGMLLVLG